MRIHLLADEHWWGGCADDGVVAPYGTVTREPANGLHIPCSVPARWERDLRLNPTMNQMAPLLLSDQGRYIWSRSGFRYTMDNAEILLKYDGETPLLAEGFHTLRGAYLAASRAHFPPDGKTPPSLMFTAPQFSTWIEMLYEPTQEKVMAYAQCILNAGYKPGVLILDSLWSDYHGRWDFNRERFPDPATMIRELHRMGFILMLWVVPFVTPDTVEFRYLRDRGCLVRTTDGSPAIKSWWDGYSAVLDMSNPDAVAWLKERLTRLQSLYGVDGFKLDAGDACYYSDEDVTYAPVTPNDQSEAWSLFGLSFSYNEYRSTVRCGGRALAQRLRDKLHDWGRDGLQSVVPAELMQGLLGYPYSCPDMIGGGEYQQFTAQQDRLDPELFVRYAQAAALMPMMQFSAAPWRVLPPNEARLCREAALLHQRYADEIQQLARDAAQTGEPIVRFMEYVFPHQGLAHVTDAFMLGENILVAPVLKKGARSRPICFPTGQWHGNDGTDITGPCVVEVSAPLERLPVYVRIEKEGNAL